MGILSENPFIVTENALESLKECDILIADFHGEATAEKIAFAKYFDGKINCVFGTHTHVQTADETILEKGTGYITDLGMTGTLDGVLGMKKEIAFKRFLTTLPERYIEETKGNKYMHGVLYILEKNNDKKYSGGKYIVTEIERLKMEV